MNASLTIIMLVGLVAMALVIIALAIWVAMLSGRVRRLSDMFIDFQTKSQTSVQIRQLSSTQPEITTIEQVQNTVAQTRAEHEEQVNTAKTVAKVKKARAAHAAREDRANHRFESPEPEDALMQSTESFAAHAATPQAQPMHAQTYAQGMQANVDQRQATHAQSVQSAQSAQSQPLPGQPTMSPQVTQSLAAQAGVSQPYSPQAYQAAQGQAAQGQAAMRAQASQGRMQPQGQASLQSQGAQGQMQVVPGQTIQFQASSYEDEEDNEFFEKYRENDSSESSHGRRKKPSIPFGKDKNKLDKQESYVRNAVDNDFDPDSIDFSRVSGYKDRFNE